MARLAFFVSVCLIVGCSEEGAPAGHRSLEGGSPDAGTSGGQGQGNTGGTANLFDGGLGAPGGATAKVPDISTCEGTRAAGSYVGCEYVAVPLGNVVRNNFNFTVAIANAGADAVDVTLASPPGAADDYAQSLRVPPGEIKKIPPPWREALKGPSVDAFCNAEPPNASSVAFGYLLSATAPVSVYQFNPLDYEIVAGGSEAGCQPQRFSRSNDASLLLPTTAATANYRIVTWRSNSSKERVYFAIIGTHDDTSVTVQLGPTSGVLASSASPAAEAGEQFNVSLDRAQVIQFVASGAPPYDLSGTLVQSEAGKPVQVLAGSPCAQVPSSSVQACDHLEESVFPIETLGSSYVVVPPTGPAGQSASHVVRLAAADAEVALEYIGQAPPSAPNTIPQGGVIELGESAAPFVVSGSSAFSVSTFVPGGEQLDPDAPSDEQRGDPSQSVGVAVEQFREDYVFLAPPNYDVTFLDVVAPVGTALTLDGNSVGDEPEVIAGTDYEVYRLDLPASGSGGHRLRADKPVGIEIIGYGKFTSYRLPGGLNLQLITPPPPSIR